MLEKLKEEVYKANIELWKQGLIIYTWGNVSGFDKESRLVVIKPSGIDYDILKPEDMVIVDLNGVVIEGALKPSSDTPTHLKLYQSYPAIGGIAHTHSKYATVFAQAGKNIPALGTTHADYFYGDILCTRSLTEEETKIQYEENTGKVILETVKQETILANPGILVKNHGPFTWGKTPAESVYHAVVLEAIAKMAYKTMILNPEAFLPKYILEKHYYRKHGKNAYYGQKEEKSNIDR